MLRAFDFERFMGVEWFSTSTPGIDGKLRFEPEDFAVEELGEPRPGEGVWALKVRHTNMESGALKEKICRAVGLREGDVTFAGTKDKRAVVTQWITINRRTPPELNIEGLEVLEQRQTSCLLRSGEHDGNRFAIRIRNTLGERTAMERVKNIVDETRGVWPNFFGIQRFGAYRPVTHLAGRALVKSGAEEALKTYIGYVGNAVGQEKDARSLFASGASVSDVLAAMPYHLDFERRMLRYLCEAPEDYDSALTVLPRGLVQFFIHSYQSYIFNRILSKRIESEISLTSPVEGDLIRPVSARIKGGRPRFVPVTSSNISVSEKAVSRGKGWITIALPGSEGVLADGEPGELERRVLEEEGLEQDDFVMKNIPGMSSKGTRRQISLVPKSLEFCWDDGLLFSFTLPPGGYATTVLREVIKSPDPLSY